MLSSLFDIERIREELAFGVVLSHPHYDFLVSVAHDIATFSNLRFTSDSLSSCCAERLQLGLQAFLIVELELVIVQESDCLYHEACMSEECNLISSVLKLDSHSNFQGVEVSVMDLNLNLFSSVEV